MERLTSGYREAIDYARSLIPEPIRQRIDHAHYFTGAGGVRACLERGCPNLTRRTRCARHEAERQARRNADPRRIALYGGDWPAESRAIRAATPWCVVCGAASDLTVDHPTRDVLCRACHGRREAARRAGGTGVVEKR